MRKLTLVSLAASAAFTPAAALAQIVAPPPAQDVPNAQLNLAAPPAGVSWIHRAPQPAPHAAPVQVRHHPTPPVRSHVAAHPVQPAHVERRAIVHRSADSAMHGGQSRNHYPNYRRVERGHAVPGYWSDPRFHVRNWGVYGFQQPVRDHRWIRYYDDALLIDRHGRVHDGRYDMDWDRYGERWGYDDRGVPIYVGDGDYYPEERDYAWVESYDRDYAEGGYYEDRGGYGPTPYGHGYYGYYGWGPVTITETTTTTAPTVTTVTYYD